jgi:hypothetical protein
MTSPTRAAFLAASAATLAACAKNSGAGSMLPGLSPSASGRAPSATPAEQIPQRVLMSPIIGEARRYDGATAPAGWMKAEGQRLPVSNYRMLVAILGRGGSRDAATFVLPATKLGWIIAVAGTDPGNPRAVAALHRGAGGKLGVSVEGAEVYEAPLRFAPLTPPSAPVETWFPGRLPTPDEIEAAQRKGTEITFPEPVPQYHGAPHAISQ